jgi:hypothetical protein
VGHYPDAEAPGPPPSFLAAGREPAEYFVRIHVPGLRWVGNPFGLGDNLPLGYTNDPPDPALEAVGLEWTRVPDAFTPLPPLGTSDPTEAFRVMDGAFKLWQAQAQRLQAITDTLYGPP